MVQRRRDHPEDLEYERALWKARKVETREAREEKRRRKAKSLTLNPDSERWLDILEATPSEDTNK
jgi:hypothetical protein